MSNGRSFRPVSKATRGRVKSRAYRGPMGRVRAAALSLDGPRDLAPWETGTGGGPNGRNTVARRTEAARRQSSPWPGLLVPHARLPRSARRPLTRFGADRPQGPGPRRELGRRSWFRRHGSIGADS